MSDLASNNPFRDMDKKPLPPHPSQPHLVLRNSKNPFKDVPSLQSKQSKEISDRKLRKDREDSTSRRRLPDLVDHVGDRHTKDGHNEQKSSRKSTERAESRHIARPTHSAGSNSSAARPQRPRSISETSASTLKKERSTQDKRRQRSEKEKQSSSVKPRKHLDKIDLLDVTGFTSAGGFHHDGPFDACNPNRNKNLKKAPVLAFAKDSTAMTMAAGPPIQPVYFGDHIHGAESFSDYGNAMKTRPDAGTRTASFDPATHTDPIHGYESVGLGTTTFLEGAPASRSAMLARTVSDNGSKNEIRPRATSEYASSAGLGRKKSVLQKIRGAYRDRANDSAETVVGSPPSSPSKQKEEHSSYFLELHDVSDSKSSPARDAGLKTELGSNKLSPLYRPASSEGELLGSNSGPSSLIKRVKSLRVNGRKRTE